MLDKEKADTLGSPDGASVLNEEQGHESIFLFCNHLLCSTTGCIDTGFTSIVFF
jgi:hypothetical protein